MSRAVVVLNTQADREKASRWCLKVKAGTTVTFTENKRTIPQNDRMWAMLTQLSKKAKYHGIWLTADGWKMLFVAQARQELKMLVPNLDNNGFVDLGGATSNMTVEEISAIIELIFAYAARADIDLEEPPEKPS